MNTNLIFAKYEMELSRKRMEEAHRTIKEQQAIIEEEIVRYNQAVVTLAKTEIHS